MNTNLSPVLPERRWPCSTSPSSNPGNDQGASPLGFDDRILRDGDGHVVHLNDLGLPSPLLSSASPVDVEHYAAAWENRVSTLGASFRLKQRLTVHNSTVLARVLRTWIIASFDLALTDRLSNNSDNPNHPWARRDPPGAPYDRAWLDQSLLDVLSISPEEHRPLVDDSLDRTAAFAHQETLAAAFLAAGACPTPEGLFEAASWGNPRLLQRLLAVPPRGTTAWPSLADRPDLNVPGMKNVSSQCVWDSAREILGLLRRVGVRLHEPQPVDLDQGIENGSAGKTAFLVATWWGNLPMMIALWEHGADPNQTMDQGVTPLHQALSALRNKTSTLDLLLDMGADPQRRTAEGLTPMQWAAWQGQEDLVEHLIERGVDPLPYHEGEHGPVRDLSLLDTLRSRATLDPSTHDRPLEQVRALIVNLEQRLLRDEMVFDQDVHRPLRERRRRL